MVHLIKNDNGSFDAVTVSCGRLTWHTSPQEYNRRIGAIGAIKSAMKSFGSISCRYQDDTVKPSVIFYLPLHGKQILVDRAKVRKPYIPNKK